MLDKKVFSREIERLMQFYPTWIIKYDDKATIGNWYKIFEDYKDDEFEEMVTKFIKTSKFNPTVAGLIEVNQQPAERQKYTGFNDYYDDGED